MAESNLSFFTDGLILLSGAVISAPLFKRIGLGTVLGYLAAGIVIGPVLGWIADGEDILHFAELGVVLLLFVLGLEIKPSRLWQLRREIFGLGLTQVMVTGILIAALTYSFVSTSLNAALVIGFGLALSSTAFALQILEDKGILNTKAGQRSFSILLFQDLAIVPLLAVLPLLATQVDTSSGAPAYQQIAIAVGAVAILVFGGRYLLNPLFQIIASTGAREAMIAAALFVVMAAAIAMQLAGLSMAMGAFLAGVLLAESSYRHELEADIEPFRGILLGLFFMAVGLSLDLNVVYDNITFILLSVPVLMAAKATILYISCRIFGSPHNESVEISLILPQGGEFGFVIFTSAAVMGIFDSETASLLIAIVTVSMAFTPLASLLSPLLKTKTTHEEMEEDYSDAGADVLMIGFSRFAQIASQTLLAGGVDVTILDHSAERIRSANKFGFKIYFGDGTRKDVLEAAGIRRAKIVAVCTHKKEITDKVVDLIKSEYPTVRIFARSYDRVHTLSLREREVDYEIRETFESGLLFGRKTLEALGSSEEQSHNIAIEIKKMDEHRLKLQASEGMLAGLDTMHRKPVTPEPLIDPSRNKE